MLDIVDRIIVIEGGKVVADGPKKDIINSLTKSAKWEKKHKKIVSLITTLMFYRRKILVLFQVKVGQFY